MPLLWRLGETVYVKCLTQSPALREHKKRSEINILIFLPNHCLSKLESHLWVCVCLSVWLFYFLLCVHNWIDRSSCTCSKFLGRLCSQENVDTRPGRYVFTAEQYIHVYLCIYKTLFPYKTFLSINNSKVISCYLSWYQLRLMTGEIIRLIGQRERSCFS